MNFKTSSNRCLWFCVSNDKYELPISPVFESGSELAEFLGVSANKVYCYDCPSREGRISGRKDGETYKIVKAQYEEDEWKEIIKEIKKEE